MPFGGFMTRIRKAVFPAAGLGTRFLPATKAQPKEMLPLVDKPIIQYVIEEAVASGLTSIIIVTGKGKNAIEDHFDVSHELERLLESRGQTELLEQVRAIGSMINVAYVRQGEQLGLGHAVLQARDLVGDEPFAVMLGDDIIDSAVPCMRQMIDVFDEHGGPVIAVQRWIPPRSRRTASSTARPVGDSGRVYRDPRPGGEAERRGCPVGPRHHRTLHLDARHLRCSRDDTTRPRRRDSAHERAEEAAAEAGDPRLPLRGNAPRRREQARLPESHGRVRAQTTRSGWSRSASTCARSRCERCAPVAARHPTESRPPSGRPSGMDV